MKNTIYCTVYTHLHGVDVHAYTTQELAEKAVVANLLLYVNNEFEETATRNTFRALARAGDYAGFIDKWANEHQSETISIDECELLETVEDFTVTGDEKC